MSHPNIAQFIDGGETASGRPYFVMELVRGVPITEFCDQNHYAAEERLKLFVSVCQAVQHAHQKGIIHRDIKPSNVMVTLNDGTPVVKIIDFGVAKAIEWGSLRKPLFTIVRPDGRHACVHESGAGVDGPHGRRYALGRLLARRTSLRAAHGDDADRDNPIAGRQLQRDRTPDPRGRAAAAQHPVRSLGDSATVVAGNRATDPKRLCRLLAGDLDWIVMKALEKDPQSALSSPGSFADDVERYLRGEAILARPPSTSYRIAKFAVRDRVAVAAAVAVAASLLGWDRGLPPGKRCGRVRRNAVPWHGTMRPSSSGRRNGRSRGPMPCSSSSRTRCSRPPGRRVRKAG